MRSREELLADTDTCVKCGLCLPHCPTYGKTYNENESPRGRIALIQAWAGRQLEAGEKLVAHIDNCLLCRSCERVCPAEVQYGQLIDNFRGHFYADGHTMSLSVTLVNKISLSNRWSHLAQLGLRIYQITPLQKIVRLLGVPKLLKLDNIDRLLPVKATQSLFSEFYQAAIPPKGSVGLFFGCMGFLLDHMTIQAAIRLLTVAGFNVYLPEQQNCCGALALHDGDIKTSEQLETINSQAFAKYPLDAIVTIASGCGGRLKEYQQLEFAEKVVDISEFFMRSACEFSEQLNALPASVCLHTPCSLRNVMREEKSVLKLLQQIPEIRINELPETLQCCGSAGAYLLKHPEMSQALLSDLLDTVLATSTRYFVSSNIGCALHIAAGLRERGVTMEVVHPVVLMARQLKQ